MGKVKELMAFKQEKFEQQVEDLVNNRLTEEQEEAIIGEILNEAERQRGLELKSEYRSGLTMGLTMGILVPPALVLLILLMGL